MDLERLLTLVHESDAGDWSRISTGGTTGPTYLTSFSQVSNATSTWLETETHHSLAVHRGNVSLSLAWGLSDLDDNRSLPWTEAMPDTSAHPVSIDVLWNGSLIHRENGLVVDGGRMQLPLGAWAEGGKEVVTQFAVDLFQLVHGISSGAYDYLDYFRRTGMEIVGRGY